MDVEDLQGLLALTAQMRFGDYVRMTLNWPAGTAIDLVEPTINEQSEMTFGQWGGYWVRVYPQIFNDRLVLAEQMHPTGLWPGDGSYDHGWCYPKGGAAIAALLTWDPLVEAEPAGYERRATDPLVRVAGEQARYLSRGPLRGVRLGSPS